MRPRRGAPIAFELAPANAPKGEVGAELRQRADLHGYTVIVNKSSAGEEFKALTAELGAIFPRPTPRYRGLHSTIGWMTGALPFPAPVYV